MSFINALSYCKTDLLMNCLTLYMYVIAKENFADYKYLSRIM